MVEHPLYRLSLKYPQLLLPIADGQRNSQLYKDTVLRGIKADLPLTFSMNENDSLSTVLTPAGEAEIVYIYDRNDFEHAVKCLAYRCDDVPVPKSMGATSLSGLINWEKLRMHMNDDEDFKAFTSDKKNYLDSLIILSSGPYSAVSADMTGLDEREWIKKSFEIRKYHELTHFVSGKLFPQNKEALRDEIIADMMGLIAAFDRYDTDLARLFLGIEGNGYRQGGRLENYVDGASLDNAVEKADNLISLFEKYLNKYEKYSIFDMLIDIEREKIGK